MQKILSLKSLTFEKHSTAVQALWVALFTSLTVVGAWFEIPAQPVPFTLQTFFVLMAGAVLGAKNGSISQLTYLLLGVVGIPVFSGFSFGVAKLFGPTGGYLLSFPVAAFAVGSLIKLNKSFLWTLLTMVVGMSIILSFGTLFLNFVYFNDWNKSIVSGFLIFTWWDVLKIIAAASIYRTIKNKSITEHN
jgi:biotin transport system substrate-specific component